MFGKKQQPTVTIQELLGNDAVKKTVEEFINDYLPKTKGVIIICDVAGDCQFITGGMSQGDAVKALDVAHFIALKELLR